MGVLAIELNDTGLCAARSDAPSGAAALVPVDDGKLFSPGYAWRRNGTLVTGSAAARRACLHPREVDNRFWDLCDTAPLDASDTQSPNRAEVACAHLEHVGAALRPWDEDVVIAVPTFYEPRQLGIVVAMARELELPLHGLVPSPLAVDHGSAVRGATLTLDLSLHRCVLSVVETGDRVRLGRNRSIPGVGLDVYRRQWIRAIGDAFVRSTRFDPLHDAAAEQQLRDELPGIVEGLAAHATHDIELASGAHVHRVPLTDRLLRDAGHELNARVCADVQAEVAAGAITAIRLAHEAGHVPGLRSMLESQVAIPVHGLEAGAPALGLARAWPDRFDAAPPDGVAYYTDRKS